MQLDKIYDFTSIRRIRQRNELRKKISKISENANYLTSIIELKLHFRNWIEINSQSEKNHDGEKVKNG